ncbi:DHA2 family multidrug resistance protein-like MFS transporter [Amaricoccus macauensis]|uniref:DHA2 family multidrug resistance protein-like MFS transporter n=1 Tax=Amaricoccus macauensis TaxID=57001 RepID=A0A840SRA3_9RHOB|nr:MFS transporter [Amaricoccus macauensis]MBB5223038.1 DHA2 family multidrug resistance protein-like MFS transporter [Amaricoccus macauensis]
MTDEIHSNGLPTPRRHFAVLAIAIGIAMAVLDGTVVNVALPSIVAELGTTPAAGVWVINAYQLVIVALLMPLASLGERVGYRRVYQVGIALFTLGSLVCAFSGTLPALIAARVVQGVGGAAIMSVNGALVRHTYPDALLGRGVGLNGLVVSLSAAVAPSLAAGILAVGNWPWLFAVNVPFGLLNLWLALRFLPRSEESTQPFDWTSAVLSAVMLGLFFIGADAVIRGAAAAVPAAIGIVVSIGLAVLLVRRGSRQTAPLIPVDLFRDPVFALSVSASICAFAAFTIAFVALPFYFQSVLGLDQVTSGLLMTPWPVALGFAAPLAGWLSDRVSAGGLGAFGMVLLAVGLALLTFAGPETGAFGISWRMAVCGFGFGFFQAPNNRQLLSSAPRSRAGAASGMLATARLLGMTIGATVVALVFLLTPERAEPVGLAIGTGLAIAAALLSGLRLSRRARAKGEAVRRT